MEFDVFFQQINTSKIHKILSAVTVYIMQETENCVTFPPISLGYVSGVSGYFGKIEI